MTFQSIDRTIIEKIDAYSATDSSYWSFKGRSTRKHCHALIQYPAMMVPEMQGELIDAFLGVDPNISTIYDPFVGSGTTLGEAMIRGLDFFGLDINPLAVLACNVKSGPFYIKSLKEKSQVLIERIHLTSKPGVKVAFEGIDKWFTEDIQSELNIIHSAIKLEESKWARRVFWLSLATTVRSKCNSRTSTYKLHIKPLDEIRNISSAIKLFEKTLNRNISNIESQKNLLAEGGFLGKAKPKSHIVVKNADAKTSQKWSTDYDLVVSSPPYGDNATTVTYGQFSYLPLKWIDLADIEDNVDDKLLGYKNAIDSSSLGGSLRDAESKRIELFKSSGSLRKCAEIIEKINEHNVKKLVSFAYDLDLSLSNTLAGLRMDGYMIWTLGNRRISNIEVPLDKIMRELLEQRGCEYVHQIERTIHSKRMASRNQIASTMGQESVLIMRKVS